MEIIEIFNPSESGCAYTIIKISNDDGTEQDCHFLLSELQDVNFKSDDPVFCAVRKAIFDNGLQTRRDLKTLIGLKF